MNLKVLIAACAALGACSPPAPTTQAPTEPPAALSTETANAEVLGVATPVVSASIGQRVTLAPTQVAIRDDWAWIVAQPLTPGGGAIDWATTSFAVQAREGVLDGGGTTYVLLKRENGQWRVVEHAIGPTDVAWTDWPTRHGAPADLMGLPPG